MNDCKDCYEEEEDSWVLCEPHWIALNLDSFNHRGFCQECCDKPSLDRATEEYGVEAVDTAIETMRPVAKEYWTKIKEGNTDEI